MQFRLKNNKKYLFKRGGKDVLSNDNLTKARALRFLRDNTEYRKTLFDILPENVDELLNEKYGNEKS